MDVAFGLENAARSPVYSAIWTTQELLEMVGVATLILALLDYLILNYDSLTVELRSGELAGSRFGMRAQHHRSSRVLIDMSYSAGLPPSLKGGRG